MTPFYRENNIVFRIASADALSRFKKVQAHSFIQITRKDIEFGRAAREVLLLSYDRFSNWLYRMERSFLMAHHGPMSEDLKRTAFMTLIDEFNTIEEVCERHAQIFDDRIRKFIRIIHHYSSVSIQLQFNKAFELDQDKAYAKMVDVVSSYLQHLLIAMHEYNNNLLRGKNPFICISEFSLLASVEPAMVVQRAKFFVEELGADISFEVKNFTEHLDVSDCVDVLLVAGINAFPEKGDKHGFESGFE